MLPCYTCKYKIETNGGYGAFVKCNDETKKLNNFTEDPWNYNHICKAHKTEDEIDVNN